MIKTILAAAKNVLAMGFNIITNAPIVGVIKTAVFIGVIAFTTWVLIARIKKMHSAPQEEHFESPVDAILGKHNYVSDPEAYDDLDPAAKKLMKKLNPVWKSKKKRKKEAKREKEVTRVVSVFDTDHDDYFDDGPAPLTTRYGYDDEDDEPKPRKKVEEEDSGSKPAPEYHFYKNATEALYAEMDRKVAKKESKKQKAIRKAKARAKRKKAEEDDKYAHLTLDEKYDLAAKMLMDMGFDYKVYQDYIDEMAESIGLKVPIDADADIPPVLR